MIVSVLFLDMKCVWIKENYKATRIAPIKKIIAFNKPLYMYYTTTTGSLVKNQLPRIYKFDCVYGLARFFFTKSEYKHLLLPPRYSMEWFQWKKIQIHHKYFCRVIAYTMFFFLKLKTTDSVQNIRRQLTCAKFVHYLL